MSAKCFGRSASSITAFSAVPKCLGPPDSNLSSSARDLLSGIYSSRSESFSAIIVSPFFVYSVLACRYSGRTQKQVIEYVREHHKRREPFER